MKTIDGENYGLSVTYCNGSKITPWYVGLINSEGFDGVSAADTPASHPGWSELTDYVSANRPAWVPGVPAGGVVAGDVITFAINVSAKCRGFFLCSNSGKGGASGIIDHLVLFPSEIQKSSGESLKVRVTARLAGN